MRPLRTAAVAAALAATVSALGATPAMAGREVGAAAL
jgi:hypothetical protein